MKTAVVTGSSRGIGRGIAQAMHGRGWRVIFSGTHAEPPEGLPEGTLYVPCDIARKEDRDNLIASAVRATGRLDLLVNNAGVAPLVRRDILEMTEESFDRVMGINLRGTLFLTQAAALEMLREKAAGLPDWGARIVNIGSMSAYTSSVSRGEYCISKAGLSMVTRLFADRLAGEGIRVFEVRPGIIRTDMTSPVQEKYEKLIAEGLLPIPRMGTPEDVAKMVLACAEGYLDYACGQVLDADGGFSLRRL